MLNTTFNLNSVQEDIKLKNTLIGYRKSAITHEVEHDTLSNHVHEDDLAVKTQTT